MDRFDVPTCTWRVTAGDVYEDRGLAAKVDDMKELPTERLRRTKPCLAA